jgi:prepilin-type N-terminal cleavage/methylation domain-containing protein
MRIRIQSVPPPDRGVSMVELVIALTIVAILAGVFIASIVGLKSSDNIDRVAQQIYNDLLTIRSAAITQNRNQRINFASAGQWRIEAFNAPTNAWIPMGDVRYAPTDTYLTSSSYQNALSNLEATPRGLFQFNSGAIGAPFVVVTGLGTSKTKSINVHVGGEIELRTP